VSSVFIGLSPELELALYTLCVLLKPNDACTVSLGGKKVDIRTHIFTQVSNVIKLFPVIYSFS
jgi:hypothetical protein